MTGEPPTRPDCTGDHCVTCGDVAVQVRVVRLLPDDLAVVDTGRGEMGGAGWEGGKGWETVSVALVPAAAGDMILVHAGEAIAVVRAAIP
ncbi:MAG TPA: hydrogenase assembly protein HupF [Trebonia sp.]